MGVSSSPGLRDTCPALSGHCLSNRDGYHYKVFLLTTLVRKFSCTGNLQFSDANKIETWGEVSFHSQVAW